MNIVIIDDDFATLESTVYYLNKLFNFKVEEFNNEERAIEHLKRNSKDIDMVFIDERMPVSGRVLGKQILQEDYALHLPMIMLTGHDKIEYAIEALSECGFDYFVWKNNFRNKEQIQNTIDHIKSLPSVRLKKKFKDSEIHKSHLIDQLNESLVKQHIENLQLFVKNTRDKKTYDQTLMWLEIQETVLTWMKDLGIRPTSSNLAGGMCLVEKGNEFLNGDKEKKETLESLLFTENYKKYGLRKNSYNRIKKHFQKQDENKVYTKTALYVKSIFSTQSQKFPTTLNAIEKGKNNYTFVSEIISEM